MIQCHKNHVKLRLVGSIFLFSLCFSFSGFSLHMLCLNLGVAAWAPVLPRLGLGSSASAPASASKKMPWLHHWLTHILIVQLLVYTGSLFCCCLQFTKLNVVIQLAGGQVILCIDDIFPSDVELVSDSACIMWCDIMSESNCERRSWIEHVQQLLTRF